LTERGLALFTESSLAQCLPCRYLCSGSERGALYSMNGTVFGIILIVLAGAGGAALWVDTIRKRDK